MSCLVLSLVTRISPQLWMISGFLWLIYNIFHLSLLHRGLYLGYLKLRTSVDTLSIIVPNAHTNVLPHVKIQDVPNVTKDQWEWLQSFSDVTTLGEDDSQHYQQPLASSMLFERKLKIAIRKLFNALNISTDVSFDLCINSFFVIYSMKWKLKSRKKKWNQTVPTICILVVPFTSS